MSYSEQIRVVLVRPLYGGNLGSVCRAMMNCGLKHLVVVDPRADMNMEEARKMACHASSILDHRKEVPALAEAVADCGLVAGTSARLGLYRSHSASPREWGEKAAQACGTNRIAMIFGPEDHGLSNEELAFCTDIIQIPSSPEYTSLNLAQAVMVCCYEIYAATQSFEPSKEFSEEAPSEYRERMFEIWRETLLDIGFMKHDKADHMMMGLRRILSRGSLTVNDVKILMGIARQSQWAAKAKPLAKESSIREDRPR